MVPKVVGSRPIFHPVGFIRKSAFKKGAFLLSGLPYRFQRGRCPRPAKRAPSNPNDLSGNPLPPPDPHAGRRVQRQTGIETYG